MIVKISRPLNEILDEKDPIPQAYYLEVSSLGWSVSLKNQGILKKSAGQFGGNKAVQSCWTTANDMKAN